MSAFENCMHAAGLPVISIDDLNEAKEYVEKIHDAWENSGGEVEMTVGALIALGAATGLDEAALAVLGEVAAMTVLAYIAACVACLAKAGIDALRDLFAQNPAPDWMMTGLAENGVSLEDSNSATA